MGWVMEWNGPKFSWIMNRYSACFMQSLQKIQLIYAFMHMHIEYSTQGWGSATKSYVYSHLPSPLPVPAHVLFTKF